MLKEVVQKLLNSTKLTKNESLIIRLYYGFDNIEPKSYRSIGKSLNTSHETVRLIYNSAMKKIIFKSKL